MKTHVNITNTKTDYIFYKNFISNYVYTYTIDFLYKYSRTSHELKNFAVNNNVRY